MSSLITPHVTMEDCVDGVKLGVKGASLVVPADMARAIGQQLIALADAHDPLGMTPIPTVVPAKDTIA